MENLTSEQYAVNNFKQKLWDQLEPNFLEFIHETVNEQDMKTDNEKIMFYRITQILETLKENNVNVFQTR